MNIDDLTIKEAKQLAQMFSGSPSSPLPFKIGEKYIIRCVTHMSTGRVTAIDGVFITLDDAAWIADSGRWYDCLNTGALNEVEPYPESVIINTGAIVDAAPWRHELPREQT